MPTILGIESTAHTFGVAVVRNGKVLSNVKDSYTTEKGGIIPIDAARHHREKADELYFEALKVANVDEKQINAIAFSQAPGLPPCLVEGLKFTKQLAKKLNRPVVGVNHCVAHLEIGRLTGAKDPVLLYASGANTQVIAYAAGKYRIFGETLDIGIGNFIDTFARYAGIGFPGGPKIQQLAEKGKQYIELPYSVKGMDIALSGMLTNLRQKLEKINCSRPPALNLSASQNSNKKDNKEKTKLVINNKERASKNKILMRSERLRPDYTLEDLAFSLQETSFAMLVEVAERAMAHTGKKELLLGGGVGCNKRLQEMCKIMCKERGAKFFCPDNEFLVDNAAMIAFLGEIMFKSGIKTKNIDKLDIDPLQRTDQVDVKWK